MTADKFIDVELRRIEEAMTPETEKKLWDQLDAARQALLWVQKQDSVMSPYCLIMGIPPDSRGCSHDLHPPQS